MDNRAGMAKTTGVHTRSQVRVPPMLVHVQLCGLNFSAVVLGINRSAGVTLKMNLRNSLQLGDKAGKRGNPPWFWEA